MAGIRREPNGILGLELYARIHESLGENVELLLDPVDGYLYKGVVVEKVIFENGGKEEHYVLTLSKPILLPREDKHIFHVLVTPRYRGEEMEDLLSDRELVASFSLLRALEPLGCSGRVRRFKKRIFSTDEIVWIGIGELSLRRPKKPYVDPPWDMRESGGEMR